MLLFLDTYICCLVPVHFECAQSAIVMLIKCILLHVYAPACVDAVYLRMPKRVPVLVQSRTLSIPKV